MHTRQRFHGMEATRFFAALMIILFHLVHLPRLATPEELGFIGRYFAIGVPLFYLVSAFGLFLGYRGRTATREDLREYFLRRFFRIAPLFYAMMLFYVAYLYLRFGKVVTPSEVLTSALFVFNLVPQHVQGFVWASWSIGVEMAFYVILPILLFAVTTFRRALFCLGVSLALSALWSREFVGATGALKEFGNFSIIAYAPYFMVGIATYFAWLRLQHHPRRARMVLVVSLAGFASLMAFGPSLVAAAGGLVFKAALVLAISGLVLGLVVAPPRVLVNAATVRLGKASFSLYLWHPVVISMLAWSGLYRWLYVQFIDAAAYGLAALATLATLVPISLLTYRYIEVPGMRLADRFVNRTGLGSIAVQPVVGSQSVAP